VFVYLHGGYWQWGSVLASSFMAKNFTDKDIILVALGYDLAPNGFILN
jgi:carboxylesterase type B